MAEHSSGGLAASESAKLDLSSDSQFLASQGFSNFEGCTFKEVYRSYEDKFDDDQDQLLSFAEKHGAILTKPNRPESEEGFGRHQTFGPEFAPFDEGNINPSFYEYTRINKDGLIELDIKKLERKVLSSTLDEISNSQKEINVESLREKLKNFEILKKGETSAKQSEPEKSSSVEELQTEKLTPYNYERKNKLLDRKPHLKQMAIEFLRHNFDNYNFTEEGLETLSKSLINRIELDVNQGISTLRRVAYPKLCEKHFSPKFPSGELAEEDEPAENINISVDHFEFLHDELQIDFLEQFESKEFQYFALQWEIDPQINIKVPSLIKFLEGDNAFLFPDNCLTLILAVLKNPYRKIEVFYDSELPVVKDQTAIANYLVNCLGISNILDGKDISEKLAEAIIRFANIHPSFLASILGGFNDILSKEIDEKPAYQIYCKVVKLMTSIGATIIDACLPEHFENIYHLSTTDRKRELYFHVLRASEISIANTIKHDPHVKSKSLALFYTACYNYFGRDLATRLIPIFKKFEKRKDREEQYLSKKHAIYPTKDGYMDTELRFLTRNKIGADYESLNFPTVKECEFICAGKVLFNPLQLGYVIQKDMENLSDDDCCYWDDINYLCNWND